MFKRLKTQQLEQVSLVQMLQQKHIIKSWMTRLISKLKNTIVQWIKGNKSLTVLLLFTLVSSWINNSLKDLLFFYSIVAFSMLLANNLFNASKIIFGKGVNKKSLFENKMFIAISTPILFAGGLLLLEGIAMRYFFFFAGVLFLYYLYATTR